MEITTIRHPYYTRSFENWSKWRCIYDGGEDFLNRYLYQFSSRETYSDFNYRKNITYIPAFSKSAVDEIKNSIFSRMRDVTRQGGSKSYQEAVLKDVDLNGSSMTSFMGRWVIPELLSMSRVGIFVDVPQLQGESLIENLDKKPYIYMYPAENICSWNYDSQQQITKLLLRDCTIEENEKTGLPEKELETYRLMWVENNQVFVQLYTSDNKEKGTLQVLNIPKIPFVIAEISHSLLSDVCNHQIALLNLGSSDMSYAVGSNFPFYTEQYDPRVEAQFHVSPSLSQGGEAVDASTGKQPEVQTGPSKGRRYAINTERPGFIHPSSEPLKASIGKQEQLKQEIRQLVHLSVSNLDPKMASAESKGMDNRGLEAGLSNIGLELERVERKIAEYWGLYEKHKAATVNYPIDYSLRNEVEIQHEIDSLKELVSKIPSGTLQKELSKRIVELSIGKKVSLEILEKIYREIDSAEAYTFDPEVVAKNIELGICDLKLGAKLQGYPTGTVEKAADDHADRLKRISESQAQPNDPNKAARGLPDLDGKTDSGKKEKQASKDTTKDDVVKDKTRGKGK